jgi:1-acyl-sn-glycerol-3-phosphate acyltransferase
MSLYHYHPPVNPDPKWSNQTEPSECTEEELRALREFPKYSVPQKIIQILLFLIFGLVKIISAVIYGILTGALFMLSCAIWRSLGRSDRGRAFLKKVWDVIARVFLFILGFHRIHFHGDYDEDARFIVANHTCFFDGWLFLPYEPRILAKKEMIHIPLMKDTAELFEAVPVDRSNSTGVTKILLADSKSPFLLLPEGASTSGDYMLRFHLGAFLSDLPVQPAVVRYTIYGTSRSISHISFFHHQLYQWIVFLGIPSMKVDITFLEPVSIKSQEDLDPRKFADFVALKMANSLGCRYLSLGSRAIFDPKKQNKPNAS